MPDAECRRTLAGDARTAPSLLAAPEGRLRKLVEKWREDANESTAFADNDEGAAPPQNVAHARGMAMAFNVCADELEAALAPLAEPPA